MKKVLLFSHNASLTGAPLVLANVARLLPSEGFQPFVVLAKPGPLEAVLSDGGIRFTALRHQNDFLQFLAILRREKPALVHVNSLVKTWPVLAARLGGVPVVWHVHEQLGGKRFYARLIHLLAYRVLLIAKRQHELFSGLRHATYVPNGVDPERFAGVKPLQFEGGKTVVAFVGTIEPRKGLDVLVRAASLLGDVPDLLFVVVGEPKPEDRWYEREVLDSVRCCGLEERFLFMGRRKDVAEILAGSDMLCHPAYVEAFGMVVLEAMAAKLPVVATRVGEIPHLVRHGTSGLLVEKGDALGLAESIAALAADTQLRRDMGRAGYERVRAEFTLQGQVRAITRVYRDLLASRQR
jgi:glycosyltransferase involved in cell wall biosynthesis